MHDALDGNAAAGALSDVFTPEMTTAVTTCGTCGDARPFGELRAYMQAPGLVIRCASCGTVQLRMVRAARRAWLDFRGVEVIQVELPAADR
jgi:Family of unknown function (DUF6510)